jgi:ubiquinone/menaquinone biosynthesis C-methylase UbiE
MKPPRRRMTMDPTQRFSDRVENYVKYRPGYPAAVIDTLKVDCRLTEDSVIADVGSGTGILTELFLKNGARVFGVEPNREMRAAAERLLGGHARFTSVAATAEATTLPAHSVDFVTAGQAFHWFDRQQARQEFRRILKPQGWVVLVWNERRTKATPFLEAYEKLLLTYAVDYASVDHRLITDEIIAAFFRPGAFKLKVFESNQPQDFEGCQGRLLSASYTPRADHPNYEPRLAELRSIFDAYQVNGTVPFEYDTKLYYGQLPAL